MRPVYRVADDGADKRGAHFTVVVFRNPEFNVFVQVEFGFENGNVLQNLGDLKFRAVDPRPYIKKHLFPGQVLLFFIGYEKKTANQSAGLIAGISFPQARRAVQY